MHWSISVLNTSLSLTTRFSVAVFITRIITIVFVVVVICRHIDIKKRSMDNEQTRNITNTYLRYDEVLASRL